MRAAIPLRRSDLAHVVAGPGHAEADVVAVARIEHPAQLPRAGEVDVGHADGVEDQHLRRAPRGQGRRHLLAEVDGVGVPERRGEEDGEDPGQLCRVGVGGQRRPAGAARRRARARGAGRALRRIRSRMASTTATAMPCSTPISTTASSVTAARANSKRSKRAMATRSCTWKSRSATKIRMAASVASGTSLSTPANGMSRTHDRGRAERAGLGAPAGRGDRAGPRRAGVDRERADQAGHDAPGADAEEVAAGVDVVAALVREGPRRGRGLGDDDERHHRGQRRQALQGRPRQAGQADRGRARLDRTEHRHAVRLQVERGHQRGRTRPGRSARPGCAGRAARRPPSRAARPRRWRASSRWRRPGG